MFYLKSHEECYKGNMLSRLTPSQVFLILYLFLLYLHFGTGIHSDDYSLLGQVRVGSFTDTILSVFSTPIFLFSPIAIFFDFIQFFYFGYEGIYYDIVKSFVSLFAIYAAWLFSKQYLACGKAYLFAFVFVFYPIHDAVNYWTTGTYMLLTGSWLMLSQVFINNSRFIIGSAFGLLGAFWSYASPPLVAGLSITFLLRREYRKFLFFVILRFYMSYIISLYLEVPISWSFVREIFSILQLH